MADRQYLPRCQATIWVVRADVPGGYFASPGDRPPRGPLRSRGCRAVNEPFPQWEDKQEDPECSGSSCLWHTSNAAYSYKVQRDDLPAGQFRKFFNYGFLFLCGEDAAGASARIVDGPEGNQNPLRSTCLPNRIPNVEGCDATTA